MLGDRDRGLTALKWYFDHSDLPHNMSYEDFVGQYDAQGVGRSIEYFGGALRDSQLSQDEVQRALENVIHSNPGGIPNIQDLQLALLNPAMEVHFSDVVKDTIADVKTTANFIDSKVTKYALLAGGILALWYLGPLVRALAKKKAAA